MNFIQKILSLGVILLMSSFLIADEGMWTPDNLPIEKLKTEYGFQPKKGFLKKIQLSSVRFNDGGSGSFVSDSGLLLTNHHVAMGQLHKLSSANHDYVQKGFFAKTSKEELHCPDLEINILVETKEVTSEIQASIQGLKDLEEIKKAKNAIIANIEKKAFEKTGMRSDVVTLYEGGEYWLYSYKKMTDIRLVFAPELALAAFGGDPDNFQYPRYALDFAFFRAYENGKPYKPKEFLKWNSEGLKDGELSFVSGHPGSTDRHKTLSQMFYLRDFAFPESLKIINTKLKAMREYAERGKEQERRSRDIILGLENSLKAIEGEYNGLKSPELFREIEEREQGLKNKCAEKPELLKEFGDTWERIEQIQNKVKERQKQVYYYRLGGRLYSFALGIIRYAEEMEKPNEKRYEEFRDSSLDSWKHSMLSSAPIYKDQEEVNMRTSLEMSKKELNADDPFLQNALGKQDSSTLVKKMVEQTNLHDPKFRRKLIEGGKKLIDSSSDPLLVWMRGLEPILRKNRDWLENEIETPLEIEGGKIARLKFALFGKTQYPDATFTLRLSYGKKIGYEVDGWKVPSFTSFYGMFERNKGFFGKPPYHFSAQLLQKQNKVNLEKAVNFVTTHDITGGNSGSPVINQKGEIVGLIFDGNAYSHVLNYVYSSERARAVSVATEGIEETLKNIYSAERILKELKKGGK